MLASTSLSAGYSTPLFLPKAVFRDDDKLGTGLTNRMLMADGVEAYGRSASR
jgi:hypothetical protein